MLPVKSEEGLDKILDCNNSKRNLWLVKVPKYLSEQWQSEAGKGEVGKLRVQGDGTVLLESTGVSEAPSSSASSSSAPTSLAWSRNKNAHNGPMPIKRKPEAPEKERTKAPRNHRFMINDLGSKMSFAVFSEDKSDLGESEKNGKSGRLSLEGRVVKRAEVRPPPSDAYMRLKRDAIEEASKPTRSIMQMDRAAVKYKPVNIHSEMAAKEKQKKDGKSVRMDKDHVLSLIFNAFEKHQYYKLVDLASLIKQPGAYVKELLNEVGNYCMVPPHKHLWELKPEYRHYKNADK